MEYISIINIHWNLSTNKNLTKKNNNNSNHQLFFQESFFVFKIKIFRLKFVGNFVFFYDLIFYVYDHKNIVAYGMYLKYGK